MTTHRIQAKTSHLKHPATDVQDGTSGFDVLFSEVLEETLHTLAFGHFYFTTVTQLWNSLSFIELDNYLPVATFPSNFDSKNPLTFHCFCPC